MNVIPDFIEPVEGWRTFKVVNGVLHSPTYPGVWEPGKPFQAECLAIKSEYIEWVLDRSPVDDPLEAWHALERQPNMALASVGSVSASYSSVGSVLAWYSSPEPPEPPNVVAPPGFAWKTVIRKPESHHAPHEQCHCGIYMVDDKYVARGYNYQATVLARVAGWGKVIPGDMGKRVQFAYPQELFVPNQKLADALAVYGVPITVAKENTNRLVGTTEPKILRFLWTLPLALTFFNFGIFLVLGNPVNAATATVTAALAGHLVTKGRGK